MNNIDTRQDIIAAAKRLYQRNMLAAGDGNISVRLSNEEILITPSGIAKAFMQPEQMAVINARNEILSGHPSSERLMHLTVFAHCPKAVCVVHAHPPTAIAWTIARPDLIEMPNQSLSELILSAGRIPIAPYARPGSAAMGDVLKEFLPQHRIIVLARHGALAWGETVAEAVNGIERLEHTAEILWKAQTLGGITNLPSEEVAELKILRKQLGERIL